jgi:hypothetical protein
MKALIDLSGGYMEDLVYTNIPKEQLSLMLRLFTVVTYGEFEVVRTAEKKSLEDLMLGIKPHINGDMPNPLLEQKYFDELIKTREALKFASYFAACFCEDSKTHITHLIADYEQKLLELKDWQKNCKELGITI